MELVETKVLDAHTARVWQVSIHPNKQHLASCSSDQTVKIYDKNLELIETLKDVHTRSIRSVAWKPGQSVLALGSFDATLSIFAFEDPKWEFLAQLEGHENEVKRVAWSSSGQFLASCSRDKSVWIWEVDEDNEDFECIAVLTEHSQDVKNVTWHSIDEVLASCSYDDTIRIWRHDDDDWTCVADLHGDCTIWSCDFAPSSDHMSLACADDNGVITVYERVSQHGGSSSGGIPNVARWDTLTEDWEVEAKLPKMHSSPAYAVKWSPCGKYIASVGGDGRVVVYTQKENESIWESTATLEQAHGVYEINSVAWLDSARIVTGGDDGTIRVFQLQTP